jgi:predicted TIM-barrel fold metal-dependent hydrolase
MILSGVFERHPDLKLVLTETQGPFWHEMNLWMDSTYRRHYEAIFSNYLPKLPSEYCAANISVGPILAPMDTADAVERGYVSNLLFGWDYPHAEGAWMAPAPDAEGDCTPDATRLHLRYVFSEVDPDQARQVLGGNAINLYGLDADKLASVAKRIKAPTMDELAEPVGPEDFPDMYSMAFRTGGPFE